MYVVAAERGLDLQLRELNCKILNLFTIWSAGTWSMSVGRSKSLPSRAPLKAGLAKLEKVRGLTPESRRLLLEAGVAVPLVRVGLWILNFRRLEALLTNLNERLPTTLSADPWTVERVAWAVKACSAYVPAASCLTQALAAQMLLTRRGYPTRLHLGFIKKDHHPLEGHAWLECEGQIVTGNGDLSRFSVSTVFER